MANLMFWVLRSGTLVLDAAITFCSSHKPLIPNMHGFLPAGSSLSGVW